MRSISRVADVSINTVTKLLIDAGKACAAFHDRTSDVRHARAVRRNLGFATRREERRDGQGRADGAGDVWTWTAIDADSKLIVSWHVGAARRDALSSWTICATARQPRAAHHGRPQGVPGSGRGRVRRRRRLRQLVKIYGAAPEAPSAATPRPSASAREGADHGDPDRGTSARPTSSAEPHDADGCGGSRGSPTRSPRSWRTTSTCRALLRPVQLLPDAQSLRMSPAMAAGVCRSAGGAWRTSPR